MPRPDSLKCTVSASSHSSKYEYLHLRDCECWSWCPNWKLASVWGLSGPAIPALIMAPCVRRNCVVLKRLIDGELCSISHRLSRMTPRVPIPHSRQWARWRSSPRNTRLVERRFDSDADFLSYFLIHRATFYQPHNLSYKHRFVFIKSRKSCSVKLQFLDDHRQGYGHSDYQLNRMAHISCTKLPRAVFPQQTRVQYSKLSFNCDQHSWRYTMFLKFVTVIKPSFNYCSLSHKQSVHAPHRCAKDGQ